MIRALEHVGAVDEMSPGTELHVRVVDVRNLYDTLGRNIVGIVCHNEALDSILLREVTQRIQSRVGGL